MSKMTEEQAKKARLEAIETAKRNVSIRSDTKRKMDLVDEACRAIVENGRPLSVPQVVRVMKEKFPSDALSISSISNQTTAGDAYKEVISAWKNYAAVIGSAKPVKMPITVSDDVTDLMLSQLKPREIIPTILAMRTSLRNARKQLQLHQIVNTSRPLDHDSTVGLGIVKQITGPSLVGEDRNAFTENDIEVLKAFLNPVESRANGLYWNEIGQLMNESEEQLSRPGLNDAIRKVLSAIE